MRTKAILLLFIVVCTLSCQGKDNGKIPSWAIGIWEGPIGLEHEETEYLVRMDLSDNEKNILSLSDDGAKFKIIFDSAKNESVRFHIKKLGNPTNTVFEDSVIDLFKVDYFPDSVIHAQMYPSGTDELWMGQLERTNK